jgi:TusA-related sulfurtransferase
LYYGKEQAEVIVNISGNMILGQAKGEIAKTFSESIGKIMQDSETFTTNTMGTTINRSKRLDWAVPVSRIASLSSGEFVGIVADNPDQKIELKAFCCEILNDHSALQKEQDNYESLPMNRKVTFQEVQENYLQIKKDIKSIIDTTIERMINDPALFGLIVN